jgi:1,4-dihydroxy-2-naphthoyl-CoA hydrolase
MDLRALRDLMPLAATLDIELEAAGPDEVRGRLAYRPELCTAGGLLHGGAIMALADSCGGVCAFLNLPEDRAGTSTIESKTNFLRGVREGDIRATTRPLHRGRTTMVIETDVVRADGKQVAKVIQTQAFV